MGDSMTPYEQKRVEEMSADDAHLVYEAIKLDGEKELSRTTAALAFSGLAAGMSMGFTLVAEAALKHHLPEAAWTPLIVKLGYIVGFVIVIMGRQQLFTENTLTPIIPLLDKQSHVRIPAVMRLWVTVLLANLLGTILFALAYAWLPVVQPEVRQTLEQISTDAYQNGEAWPIFIKAILAGWLVALMVWLLPAAEHARLWVIAIIAYLIGIGEFPHIIAGTVTVLYGVARDALPLSGVIGNYMLPTLVGNILGGVLLVAALNYAQVAADSEK